MVNNSEVHILFWDYLQIFQIPHLSYLPTFPQFDDLHEMHGFNPFFTAKSHIWFQVSTLDFPTKTIQWRRLFPATTFFSNMPRLVVAFYEVMEQRKPLGLLQPTSAGVLAKEYRWHSMGPGSWMVFFMEKPTWMIWGYHHFRKPPYLFIILFHCVISICNLFIFVYCTEYVSRIWYVYYCHMFIIHYIFTITGLLWLTMFLVNVCNIQIWYRLMEMARDIHSICHFVR